MSFWDEIDEDKEYLPFAKFESHKGNFEIIIQIVDNEPSIFKNRWGKEQWSIRVWKYRPVIKGYPELVETDSEKDYHLLVGGVRLFRLLKTVKDFNGLIFIRRFGSGFETTYKILKKLEAK